MKELVETETVELKLVQHIELSEILNSSQDDNGVVICKFCAEAKANGEFMTGKAWDSWKLDYLKRHITQKTHLDS